MLYNVTYSWYVMFHAMHWSMQCNVTCFIMIHIAIQYDMFITTNIYASKCYIYMICNATWYAMLHDMQCFMISNDACNAVTLHTTY